MWWREAIRTSTLPLSPVVWECREKIDTTWEGWEWESSVLREQPSRKIEGTVREEGDLPDGCLWVPESTGKGASDTGRERVRSKVKKKVWKRLFGHKSWRNEKWLGLLIVSVVNRNKRYNEISPDIPKAEYREWDGRQAVWILEHPVFWVFKQSPAWGAV